MLGIETSCDETAVALVDEGRQILAEVVLSQLEEHRPFGGVVPEVAARSHAQHIDTLTAKVMANHSWQEIDAIAATAGPGLIGGVMVGATFGKMLAAINHKPFIAVNHLEGHALAARLVPGLDFPYLLLLVSGGHCQLLAVEGVGNYRKLGGTIDDAVGEAFDKVAKLLGLSYPGGPALEEAALKGNPNRFPLPRPMLGRKDCDFSFSGLKTAVRTALAGLELTPETIADMAASFQASVIAVLQDRVGRALEIFPAPILVASGGVAANKAIRAALADLAQKKGREFVAPPLRYCTDNAAMIAWAGIERLKLGQSSGLDFAPRPRWPLEAMNKC